MAGRQRHADKQKLCASGMARNADRHGSGTAGDRRGVFAAFFLCPRDYCCAGGVADCEGGSE